MYIIGGNLRLSEQHFFITNFDDFSNWKVFSEPEITNIFIPFWFKMSHSAMLMLNFSDSFKGQSWNGFLKKRELIAGNFKQQMTWPRNENYITKWSEGEK